MAWLENATSTNKTQNIATLNQFLSSKASHSMKSRAANFTPRLSAITRYFDTIRDRNLTAERQVEEMVHSGITMRMLETFPEALRVILNEPIVQCQAEPPTSWSNTLLEYISREDLDLRVQANNFPSTESPLVKVFIAVHVS
jgi:anaphase-promoting complex subunit 1